MPTPKQIHSAFHEAEAEFGEDRSTEFLAAIVADRLSIEYDEVFDGLYEQAKADGRAK